MGDIVGPETNSDQDAEVTGRDVAIDKDAETSPRRRRGKELEDALLDAAWAELKENGFGGLTFEGVATRAGTSRPVVNRRWSSKSELVRAVFVHVGRSDLPTEVPDTGSLRGDVLALMSDMVRRRSELMVFITARFGAFFEETGSSFAELREDVVAGRGSGMDLVLERAEARGEVDRAGIPPRVVTLPFDLLRHDLLMTLKPVPEEKLVEIVDTVFLPLVLKE